MSEIAPSGVRPLPVWIIYVILMLQGSAVVLSSIYSAIISNEQVLETWGLVAMVGLFVFSGLVLIVVAFRIFSGTPGARTPVLVFEILILVLSMNFFLGGSWIMGLFFALPAGAALVLVFSPHTYRWLHRNESTDTE